MLDQSGIHLPVRSETRIRYFVTDGNGSVMSLRDVGGNKIKNEFSDEDSALNMAVHMAEQDEKYSIRNSLYLVQKGVIRNAA